MNRLAAADSIADAINEYLSNAGWTVGEHPFFRCDPKTGFSHNLMAAFQVQFERDIQSARNMKSSILLIKSQILLG